MASENTNPRIQLPLRFKPGTDDCRRCGVRLRDRCLPIAATRPSPENRFFVVCHDVHACHQRMMRPKLRLLPGGASY